MSTSHLLCAVWLLATPPFFHGATADTRHELLRFTLDETTTEVATRLGPPSHSADAGPANFSWFLQLDVADHHDQSHVLLFRKSDRKLVSITRNYREPVQVDSLFPLAASHTYYFRADNQPPWPVRVRLIGKDRLLIAMGVATAGQRTDQLLLIRRSALPGYLPWLADQMAKK
ncbi:MAG: hypothetical protein K2X03_05350 [Bryobacteraceae bacterium]|nr:hypothetical protein [Bryobacteraceae bacterium]